LKDRGYGAPITGLKGVRRRNCGINNEGLPREERTRLLRGERGLAEGGEKKSTWKKEEQLRNEFRNSSKGG